jgi:hypothetical protein
MLPHAGQALEGGRYNLGGVMIAIAGQIFDRHFRIWQCCLDERFNFCGLHAHGC